jgi:4a-hydroxytetrahydrobiopterin dehydratase
VFCITSAAVRGPGITSATTGWAAPTARSCSRGGGSLQGLLHPAQKGLLQLQSDGSLLAVCHPKMLVAAGDAMGLANEACLPCREGAPTLTEQEISKLLEELPGWEVVDHHHLRKAWHFTDFRSALDWVNRAGAICESQGHHAEFGLGWGHAEALIYTHKVDGLTRADAVLAARFEAMDAKNPYGAFVTDR